MKTGPGFKSVQMRENDAMSGFASFIVVECKCEIQCVACNMWEDAVGGSEREAESNLNMTLDREGWQVRDDGPHCGECIRKAEQEAEQEAERRKARRRKGAQ